jgi:hypothetical protein
MSATESHEEPDPAHADAHAGDAHADAHADDAHAHATDEDILGPIDFAAWGAGIAGVAIGLVMWLCFVMATSVAGGS